MMQRVIAHTDQKGFVNDQLFCKKKTLILQDEMGRITGTLFDHRLRKVSKDKGWRAHSKFSARNAWSPCLCVPVQDRCVILPSPG